MKQHHWVVEVYPAKGSERLIKPGSLRLQEHSPTHWTLVFSKPNGEVQTIDLDPIHRGDKDGAFAKARQPGEVGYRVHGSFRRFSMEDDVLFGRIGHRTGGEGPIADDNVDAFFGVRTAGGPDDPPIAPAEG